MQQASVVVRQTDLKQFITFMELIFNKQGSESLILLIVAYNTYCYCCCSVLERSSEYDRASSTEHDSRDYQSKD